MRAILLFVLALVCSACVQIVAPLEALEAQPKALASKTVALTMLRPNGTTRSYCSGVWVSDTTILTAHHCVEDEGEFINYAVEEDIFGGGLKELGVVNARTAQVYVLDPAHDLALLRARAPLPIHGVARVGLDSIRPGARVATMGHPLGLWWSYSSGHIAGIRLIDIDPAIVYVQTTAPTSKGNSGCGLFDEQGALIGIAHAGIPSGSNLAFYVHGQYLDALLRKQGEAL